MKYQPLLALGRAAGLSAILASISSLSPVHAGSSTTESTTEESSESALSEWWNGKYMTGNWFGVRDSLADLGFKFGGKYEGIFFGVVDSQRGSRGFYDQELAFNGEVDFAKLLKTDALEGLSGFGAVRWRDPRSIRTRTRSCRLPASSSRRTTSPAPSGA